MRKHRSRSGRGLATVCASCGAPRSGRAPLPTKRLPRATLQVIALGWDGERTSNIVSTLNLDTLSWDSWDGNLYRQGAATALVEGKLFVVGGEDDMGDRYHECCQFNMGGFMMQFDGIMARCIAAARWWGGWVGGRGHVWSRAHLGGSEQSSW